MKVIQCKSFASGRYSESIVWEGTRIKEARGQVRHNFKSELEMLMKHDFFGDDYNIDEENFTIEIINNGKMFFKINWRIEDGV